MRTSLNNIREAEQYIRGRMNAAEALLFQARLLLDSNLRADVAALRKTFALLQHHERTQMKARIDGVHKRLFNDPAKANWRKAVYAHFGS